MSETRYIISDAAKMIERRASCSALLGRGIGNGDTQK